MKMLETHKDIILKNFVELMKSCNVDILAQPLLKRNIFAQKDIDAIFSTDDSRHNKRVFFFNIMKKDVSAFDNLIRALKETNQYAIAKLLDIHDCTKTITHSCNPFKMPQETLSDSEEGKLDQAELRSHVDCSTTPLKVTVTLADTLKDTEVNNRYLEYYRCHSKRRGRVLILNNYDFSITRAHSKDGHKDRNGAIVDEQNLEELFVQMGGWVIEKHTNKTALQMRVLLKEFSRYSPEKKCDVCFVIVMSHGGEELNKTTVYGVDGGFIYTSEIEEMFSNQNCSLFKGKPKIFLYQVCRGNDIDIALKHRMTETDGKVHNDEGRNQLTSIINNESKQQVTSIRSMEDVLVGYATLQGYKAHRDPNRGTWYIEIICEIFMKHACDHSVDDLLIMVDQVLRKRMSEKLTMQTSEQGNRGFKKLYLNPGLYVENGVVKKFFE